MEKRIIELNEEEIKKLILSQWDNDEEISDFGFIVEHNGIRTTEQFLFAGRDIKLKKIIFEFEGEKD